jgi:ComF family protein
MSLPSCQDCRNKKLFFDQAKSVFSYEAEVKDLIQNLKYNDQKWLALPLASYLAKLCQEFKPHPKEVITWVPMTNLKKLARGYNQAELLARNLAKVRKQQAVGLLVKPQSTAEQNSLNLKEREKNLKGAFKLAPKVTKPPAQVILVDDVYTTGATVSECSLVLKKAGVEKVYVVTVARAV